MKFVFSLNIVAALLLLTSFRGHAQTSLLDIDRASEPGISLDEDGAIRLGDLDSNQPIPSMEGDEEYGEQQVLVRQSTWEPWSISLDASIYHTDNAGLSSSQERDDTYVRAGLSIGYTPKIKGNLFGDFSLRQHNYRYDKHSDLDFDIIEAGVGFLYAVPNLKGVSLFSRYSFYEIQKGDYDDHIFSNHSIVIGGQQVIRYSRGQQFYYGVSADLSIAGDPDTARRHEYNVYAGHRAKWTDRVGTHLSYKGSYYDYKGGRGDINQVLSVGLTVEILPWLNLDSGLSYTINESNRDDFDYESSYAGAGFSLSARF